MALENKDIIVESKESTTVGKLKEQENQIVSLKNDWSVGKWKVFLMGKD